MAKKKSSPQSGAKAVVRKAQGVETMIERGLGKTRLGWDEYFLRVAKMVAERSTCLRRKVGAVLVKEKRILATGYNGAPTGLPHCDVTGCLREKLGLKAGERIELCRGLHAEQNALLQAAAFGIDVSGSVLYSTHEPCITCAKMLINARVRRIYVLASYPDELARLFLRAARIPVLTFDGKKVREAQGMTEAKGKRQPTKKSVSKIKRVGR